MEHESLRKHYEKAYGQHTDASRVTVALRLLKKEGCIQAGQTLRVLDVGGGTMQLGRRVADKLAAQFGVQVDLEGWDLSAQAVQQALAAGEKSRVQSVCDEIPPEAAGAYDGVMFFEVLEHLVDTDAAAINLRKLMKPTGWLLLSTPNLAGWVDRLSLLFGMQPHTLEVSFVPFRFGNPVIGRLLPHGPQAVAAGHLRVFTLRALKQFLRWHGIYPVRVGGCVNHSFDVISRLFAAWWPGLVGDVVVLGKPGIEEKR